MSKKADHIEIRTVKRGIITTAFLAIVYDGDEVFDQRVFPVSIGTGESKIIYESARVWAWKQSALLARQKKETIERARQDHIAALQRRSEAEKKAAATEQLRKRIHKDVVAVRNTFGWGKVSMWTGYANVYGHHVEPS